MVNKIIGYVLAVFGLLVTALSVKFINEIVVGIVPLLEKVSVIYLIIIGIAAIIAGIWMIRISGSSQKISEVPIYRGAGSDVVGYRRMGQ